ncbi:MAG: BNR/Asp-box repeat protein [Planctomycetaceae bacterium]|nr:BNR/Asp-box repeat protein [Planctomycetaceae bacterium]
MHFRHSFRWIWLGLITTLPLALGSSLTWAQEKGKWINISDSVIAQLAQDGKKPGEYGPTSGVAVDRSNGDVYLCINGQGLWKSTDQGGKFERVDGGQISGRCETGFAIDIDPAGERLACFPVYGSAAIGTKRGTQWQKSTAEHIDAIAVDWATSSLLAIKHESGGTLIFSPDSAKTWKTIGKGFSGAGLFDANTFVAVNGSGIQRSSDAGATWTKVSDLKATGQAMRVFHGTGYWVGDKGVLVSHDKGLTWSLLGSEVKCTLGPYFGKDEKQILVGTKKGLMETSDAGQTWKLVAPLPPGIDGGLMSHIGWDPARDIFYIGRMTQPTYKFQR